MRPIPSATQHVREWSRAAVSAESGEPYVVPPTGESTGHLLAAIRRHRLVELLQPHARALELPDEAASFVERARVDSRQRVMIGLLEQARLAAALDASSIRWLAIKGSALAVQTTGDPAGRGTGDIDIFVPVDSVQAAYEKLHDMGWVARPIGSARPGSWAWRHILGTFHEMTFDGPGSTVDLHWRLDPTHHALPGFDSAWARREAVDVAGTVVQTLGPRDALAHTCHHAARDDWRWIRSLVDVHRLARRPEAWDGPLSTVTLSALRVTDAMLGLPATTPPEVRDDVRRVPARFVRRAIRAQDRPVVAAYPFPAAQTARDVRYRLAAGRSPDDAARTAVSAILPPKVVAGLDDPTIVTALPRALLYRMRWLLHRSVAWLRRDPGASVIQSPRPR